MQSLENETGRRGNPGYYLPKVEINCYNIKIKGRKFFHHPVNNEIKPYENIRKIGTGQEGNYTIRCLLDYPYFRESFKMIAIELGKQQALCADQRTIHLINFTVNLECVNDTKILFILEEIKQTHLDFSQGTMKVL